MGTTSATNALFTGTSQFSSDFQQVIQQAVQLASLPMDQMQNDLNSLTSQQSELNTLASDFTNVQSAITQVESAMGLSSYTSSVSTPAGSTAAVASVALSGTPEVGTYSLDVTALGRYATSLSNETGLTQVTDPDTGNISNASSYNLSVGTANYAITPSGNTLTDLADALNQSGYVQAVMVNIGTSATPNYLLSVQGTQLADLPIQLTANDGSTSGQALLTPQTVGAPTTYQLNGEPSQGVSTNSPTVTLSPGVTATLLAQGTTTVAVGTSTTALSSAFSSLASAYNTAMSEVNKNHGQNGGALNGQSILMELSSALHSLTDYTSGDGGISSLTSLGFSFDSKGVLSFDPSAFATATNGQTAQLASFLGSSSTGGFLQAASNTMTSLNNPTSGLIPGDLTSLANQITAENSNISSQQDKVNTLQSNLQQQMATADASIATMEQQLLGLQDLFTAEQDDSQNIL